MPQLAAATPAGSSQQLALLEHEVATVGRSGSSSSDIESVDVASIDLQGLLYKDGFLLTERFGAANGVTLVNAMFKRYLVDEHGQPCDMNDSIKTIPWYHEGLFCFDMQTSNTIKQYFYRSADNCTASRQQSVYGKPREDDG